jgi:hypothetical protein
MYATHMLLRKKQAKPPSSRLFHGMARTQAATVALGWIVRGCVSQRVDLSSSGVTRVGGIRFEFKKQEHVCDHGDYSTSSESGSSAMALELMAHLISALASRRSSPMELFV